MIYSDNAKTFKKAQELFAGKIITWKFITERAAWWGGMWERPVRSVKLCLKIILGKAFLNYEELQTFLTEAEAVLNSRPLTYVHVDSGDPSPLTPALILTGQYLTMVPAQPNLAPCELNADRLQLSKRLSTGKG